MPSADIVLIVHFFYVLFVVGSLPVIWLGAWFKWKSVRNRWFRFLHLAAILLVVAESSLGIVCPLTVWENTLRQTDAGSSFIQHWIHQIIFYTVPEGVLTAVYILFSVLVIATFKWIPPDIHRRNHSSGLF